MTDQAHPFIAIAAFDFSALGDRAVKEALLHCAAHPGSQLHAVVVGWLEGDEVRLPGDPDTGLSEAQAEQIAVQRVARLVSEHQAAGHGLSLERIAVYVATGEPVERIVALAETVDADLIILGTHGRQGLQRWVLGSVAEGVVRKAPCGVLVIRPRDFLEGSPLPRVEPPLAPGQHALKPFQHRPTYHYIHRMSQGTPRLMPAS